MNKKNEELFKCLDERDFDAFVSSFGSTITSDYFKIIEFLVSEKRSKNQFDRIDALAEMFFIELSGLHFGEPFHFNVDKNMASFQEFIYFLNVFQAMNIPYEKWEEVAKKAIDIIAELVTNSNLAYKQHPEFPLLKKKLNKILNEIIKAPEMERRYCDFLNGSL